MANGYDGEIRIKATIDSSEFDSKIDLLSRKANVLTKSLEKQQKQLALLGAQYQDLISGKLKTDEEIGLEKSLKRAERELETFQNKYIRVKNDIIKGQFLGSEEIFNKLFSSGQIPQKVLAPLNDINDKINITSEKIKLLKSNLEEVKLNPEAQNSVKRLALRMEQLQINTLKTKNELIKTNEQIDKLKSDKVKAITSNFDKLKNAISNITKNIGSKLSDGIGGALSKIASPLTGLINGFENLFNRIFRLGTLVLVFTTIRKAFQSFRDYLFSALMANEEFVKSLNIIKSNLATAFYPIYQAILPALNAMMKALSVATAYLSQFISMLFGKDISQSQAGAKALNDITQSVGTNTKANKSNSKSLKENKKAYDELGKGIKKAKGELASFDKLIVLSQDNSKVKTPSVPDTGSDGGVFTPITQYDSTYFKMVDIFDKIRDKINPTIKAFKSLGETIRSTFGEFVIKAGRDFYNDFLKPFGTWTFSKALPKFAQITENMFKNINWDKLNKSLSGLFKAVEPFAENIGNGLLWFYENVLTKIAEYTVNNLLPPFLDSLSNSISALDTVLEGVGETFKWFFKEGLTKIGEFTGGKLTDFLNKLKELTGEIKENKEALKELGEFVGGGLLVAFTYFASSAGAAATLTFFTNLAALVTPGGALITGLLLLASTTVYYTKKAAESHKVYKKFYEDMGISQEEFRRKSAEEKSKLLDEWLSAEKQFASDDERLQYEKYKKYLERDKEMYDKEVEHQRLLKKQAEEDQRRWNEFWENIGKTINRIYDKTKETIYKMNDLFLDFSFKIGNWIGERFKNTVNAVFSWIEGKINPFIDMANKVIGFANDIPGIRKMNEIPKFNFPRLAQGAVLKGGNPMLAYLNDQPKGQVNVETPLNTMIEAFNTALKNNNSVGNVTIEASGDVSSLISFLNFRLKQENERIGSNLIKGDVWL